MNTKVLVIGLSGESIFLKVDHFHRDGETLKADNLVIEPGGKGYNQAVACSKLGADVKYLTVVGDDEYGDYAIKYLEQMGVQVFFEKIKGTKTACATILTDKLGSNQVTVFRGASDYLCRNHIVLIEEAIREVDFVLLQLEVSIDLLREVIRIAKQCGTKVVLNPAPALIKSDDEIINEVDFLTPNEIEAKDIFNIPNDIKVSEYGDFLQKIVNNNVIITLGEQGCLFVKPNYYRYFKPIKVDVVDTTGAGDVFNAALTTMLKDHSIEEAIEFAVRASALSVCKPNVMNAIPTKKEVEEYKK